MCWSSRREQYIEKKRFAFAAVACNQQSLSVSEKACDARRKESKAFGKKASIPLKNPKGPRKLAPLRGIRNSVSPISFSLPVQESNIFYYRSLCR
jgi:hypothetical protein